MDKGLLPVAGGTGDQTAYFLNLGGYALQERDRNRAEFEQAAAKRASARRR